MVMKKIMIGIAAVLLFPIAVATPAAAEPPTMPCQPPDAPTCESAKDACLAAHAVTGSFGQRYVPPDAARNCWDAYRGCKGNQ